MNEAKTRNDLRGVFWFTAIKNRMSEIIGRGTTESNPGVGRTGLAYRSWEQCRSLDRTGRDVLWLNGIDMTSLSLPESFLCRAYTGLEYVPIYNFF